MLFTLIKNKLVADVVEDGMIDEKGLGFEHRNWRFREECKLTREFVYKQMTA